MQPHNPVIARNIAQEMADIQHEAGRSLLLSDFVGLGFPEEQVRKNAPEAARLYARQETRHAA